MIVCLRSHQPPGLLRSSPVHIPLNSPASAEVSEDHQAAAPPHHGHHPAAPRHQHHVRHVAQGFPREVPGQQSSTAGNEHLTGFQSQPSWPELSDLFQNEQENVPVQNWSLICDILLSRGIEAGLLFQLRQGDVLLLCEVIALPHFSLTEQIINVNHDKFILKATPESPVWWTFLFPDKNWPKFSSRYIV